MAKLTLYHAAPSRSSITRWMLEEVGEPYDIHLLNLSNGDTRALDYLAVNPMGKVPALKHGEHSAAVVFHVKPVALLPAVAVNGQRLVVHGVGDDQRQKFFGKLVRPIIVR